MSEQFDVSAIILAGGKSRRLGRDKAVEPVGGKPLIVRVIDLLSSITQQSVIVMNKKERASELPLPEESKATVDLYPEGGSLGGIFTGLSASDAEWGIVVACDMPFLNIELFQHMLSQREGHDAVVPILEGRPEPTHAIYSKKCLRPIEEKLKANDLKIARFFDDVRVKFVPEDEINRFDPKHISFFNINTQDDLDRALALVEQGH